MMADPPVSRAGRGWHHLYEGDVSWTERGHFFSWHMLLRGKTVGLRYYVTDPTFYAEANKFDAAKIIEMAKAYPNKCKSAP